MRFALNVVLVVGFLATGLLAQQAGTEAKVYKSGVETIEITINVVGKEGDPPKPLTQADFQLTENGVRQTITTFKVEQPSPTTSRFIVGYTSKTRPSVRRKIEVRVRGFKKPITRSLPPEGGGGVILDFGK